MVGGRSVPAVPSARGGAVVTAPTWKGLKPYRQRLEEVEAFQWHRVSEWISGCAPPDGVAPMRWRIVEEEETP